MNRLTKKNDGAGSWTQFRDKYLPAHNVKHKECVNKLGLLEDIEEELGIDLVTLFKILKAKELYWNTRKYGIKKTTFHNESLRPELGYDTAFDNEWSISLVWNSLCDDEKLSDYGKTWALTEEELL